MNVNRGFSTDFDYPDTKVEMSYDFLIALLQGKKVTFTTQYGRFVLIPPFKGVFMTYEDIIHEIGCCAERRIFDLLQKALNYNKEDIDAKEL